MHRKNQIGSIPIWSTNTREKTMHEDEKFLDNLGKMLSDITNPGLTEDEQESMFWGVFGIDEYDDVKVGDVYKCTIGVFTKSYNAKITGLMEGNVYLLGEGGWVSSMHSIKQFRELIKKGEYTKQDE